MTELGINKTKTMNNDEHMQMKSRSKMQSSNGDLGYGKMDLGLRKTQVSERK